MSTATTKDFDPIREDYTFFEEHATEAAADLAGYAPFVRSLAVRGGEVRLLDFGCGPGTFSARFLAQADFAPQHLHLCLVEPVEVYRQQAVERLGRFTTRPIEAWPALPADTVSRFDLVVANHVLYYVPDLDTTVRNLVEALAKSGQFLTSLAGRANVLIQFWLRAFALLGKPMPYHIAEDLQAVLVRFGLAHERRSLTYELTFPDTEENRLKILRFLLGEYLKELPRAAVLDFFQEYVQAGQVRIQTTHDQFVIYRP